MSTRLRQWSLKLLQYAGIRRFRSRTALGQPFICHVGDFGSDSAFLNRSYSLAEIAIMCGWAERFDAPVIFDVGGNVGFVATQLALLLRSRAARIYSVEPVPSTFAKLTESVRLLGLGDSVHPVCCALSDEPRCSRVWFSDRKSIFAQLSETRPSSRVGEQSTWCAGLTVDLLARGVQSAPALIKVDVEGHEVSVFEGARTVLQSADPPGLCFELNPTTLGEVGRKTGELTRSLRGYRFFYVDDFEAQRLEFGTPIETLEELSWTCNVFGVPATDEGTRRWEAALTSARERIASAR